MKVVIAGAGVIGICTAHELLDAGHEVTLVDETGFAAQASGRNAGWIQHTDIMPLASGKAWRNLPRWLADPLGPLTVRTAWLPHIVPWLLKFMAASSPLNVEASIHAIAALNGAALVSWQQRLSALGLQHHLRQTGQITLWSETASMAAAPALLARQRQFGAEAELLHPSDVANLEPAFAAAVRANAIAGGAYYPGGVHVSDPATLVTALGEAALARGALLVKGRAKAFAADGDRIGLVLEDGTRLAADRAVNALGAWSKALARTAGDDVPLDTERGYNITIPPGTLGLTRPVMYDDHGFVTSPLVTGDRIGGAVEFAGLQAPPNYARIDAFAGKLRRFLPHAGEIEGVRRLCFRPSMPDSLPVIGPARLMPQVIHAFGHGHYGLTQAAVTARMVAALAEGRPPPVYAAPYSARRF